MLDDVREVRNLNGLAQVCVEPTLEKSLPVAGHS
jgi:hypothetical protein